MNPETRLFIDGELVLAAMGKTYPNINPATEEVMGEINAASGSAIINQSSTAAWMSTGFYGVAKLAVNGITQSLANELGWRKIRINAIAPDPTATAALEKPPAIMPVKWLIACRSSDWANPKIWLMPRCFCYVTRPGSPVIY